MPVLEIDARSQVPLYEQIMDRVRALVREGDLHPGDPLPPVRQLAADLEINSNTVARAYGLLEREGIVRTAGRRGTLIAETARLIASETTTSRLEAAIDRVLEAAVHLHVDLEEIVTVLRRRSQQRPDAGSGT
jgi:GntR family transcriptional regulator